MLPGGLVPHGFRVKKISLYKNRQPTLDEFGVPNRSGKILVKGGANCGCLQSETRSLCGGVRERQILGRRRSSLRWMSESMFVKMKIDLWYFFEEIGLVFIDIIWSLQTTDYYKGSLDWKAYIGPSTALFHVRIRSKLNNLNCIV